MHSTRFGLPAVLTEHARLRTDNAVVVKTIMHHWDPRP